MDNVQFPKTGGSWTNRVKLLFNGKAEWVTMPIVRAFHGTRPICEMEINNAIPWREKILRTLQVHYGRAPFFKSVYPWLADTIACPANLLVDYNISAIRKIIERLGLNAGKLVIGSTLEINGKATELLIAMVKAVGGDTYLCGGGAEGYQLDGLFQVQGVNLLYQDFHHPVYPQFNTAQFASGLSIMDALMNTGFDETRKLIEKVN